MSGADEFRLLVLRGVEGRREFLLKDDVIELGHPAQGANPTIPVAAEGVLARHATLRREGVGYRLDPAPGALVLVNRREFPGGALRDGDIITLGAARFQFWAGGLERSSVMSSGGPGAGAAPEGHAAAHDAGRAEHAGGRDPGANRRRAFAILLILVGVVVLLVLLRSTALGPRP
jgi:hypothetical protein